MFLLGGSSRPEMVSDEAQQAVEHLAGQMLDPDGALLHAKVLQLVPLVSQPQELFPIRPGYLDVSDVIQTDEGVFQRDALEISARKRCAVGGARFLEH
jgi:hypothetical protein